MIPNLGVVIDKEEGGKSFHGTVELAISLSVLVSEAPMQGKLYLHLRSLSFLTPNLYRSTVRFNNLFALVEPYAESTSPTGLRWSKQRLKQIRRNPIPGVFNSDTN